MSQLQTHDLPDLISVNTKSGVQRGRPWTFHNQVQPGEPVYHRDDPTSYGMCISRRWGPEKSPMQCEVLWSKQPSLVNVQVQAINSQSRKLKATWNVEAAEDDVTFRDLDLAERVLSGELRSIFDVQEVDPDVTDYVIRMDAGSGQSITFKRRKDRSRVFDYERQYESKLP